MKLLKLIIAMLAMVTGFAATAEVKVEVNGSEWKAVSPTYSATSKKGYINSITINSSEFLAQANIVGGSYLCGKNMPALKEIKQEKPNMISGTCSLGKIIYTFNDNDIDLSYENTSQENVVYYFIINPDVKTVLIDDTKVKEVPGTDSGSSFKWVLGQLALDFKAEARIWGPWKGFQVWELAIPAGKTKTAIIVSRHNADSAKLNQQAIKNNQYNDFDYSAVGKSGQIPLCMIGDSITWYGKGDCWRKELLARLPNLAFVGTHTSMFGYSHAGEGGNGTGQVLARIKYIPDCPYYNLLIGTNNTNIKKPDLIQEKSNQTAEDIIKIVNELLKKKGVEKVFLSSILPCATDNPLRDQCNSATNKILREKFDDAFPKDKVVWVEYETPIRQVKDWEKKIFLHPNEEGYALIGDITAKTISVALNIKPGTESVRPGNTGVRVVNLMGENNITVCPVIAGWYLLSCKVDTLTAPNPEIILESKIPGNNTFKQTIPVKAAQGETINTEIFTNYEGYGYTRDYLTLKANGCTVSNVLLEKMRPSKKASIYGKGSYVDTASPVSKGELLEYSSKLKE